MLLKSERVAKHTHELGKNQVKKAGPVIFYECPLSYITAKTWQLLQVVNDTTDGDCNIMIAYTDGPYLTQPDWYKEAVRIVRGARAEYRAEKLKK